MSGAGDAIDAALRRNHLRGGLRGGNGVKLHHVSNSAESDGSKVAPSRGADQSNSG